MENQKTESEGCRYREHEGESTCNKVCSPGQTLCPYHQLLTTQTGAELNTLRKTYQIPRGYQE